MPPQSHRALIVPISRITPTNPIGSRILFRSTFGPAAKRKVQFHSAQTFRVLIQEGKIGEHG